MPSAQSKLQVKYATEMSHPRIWIKSRYDDLSIVSVILQLIGHLNTIKRTDKSYQADFGLEVAIMEFA